MERWRHRRPESRPWTDLSPQRMCSQWLLDGSSEPAPRSKENGAGSVCSLFSETFCTLTGKASNSPWPRCITLSALSWRMCSVLWSGRLRLNANSSKAERKPFWNILTLEWLNRGWLTTDTTSSTHRSPPAPYLLEQHTNQSPVSRCLRNIKVPGLWMV